MITKEGIASTRASCALQRAENLAALGSRKVIELCVGPSLGTLEKAYAEFGIQVYGNDINPRWNKGTRWRIGDALTLPLDEFDTAVFAPPLSVAFSGRREDSLSPGQVTPSYEEFLARPDLPSLCVLVLPGRSYATKRDRTELHKIISLCNKRFDTHVDRLLDHRKRVTKYVDVYLQQR